MSASSSTSDGSVASVLSESGAVYETSTTPAGPVTTELGYFTAGGGVYSVSSLSGGLNVVAGKTLTVGGPDGIVGGAAVSAAPSGLFADGAEVMFETVTISASASGSASMSMSMSMSSVGAGTSSMAAGGSESAGVATQSESPDAAVPKATAGAGVMLAAGAVVGMLVL